MTRTDRCPSGRREPPAKRLVGEGRLAGSNPALSASDCSFTDKRGGSCPQASRAQPLGLVRSRAGVPAGFGAHPRRDKRPNSLNESNFKPVPHLFAQPSPSAGDSAPKGVSDPLAQSIESVPE